MRRCFHASMQSARKLESRTKNVAQGVALGLSNERPTMSPSSCLVSQSRLCPFQLFSQKEVHEVVVGNEDDM